MYKNKTIILFKDKVHDVDRRKRCMDLYSEFVFRYKDRDDIKVVLEETPILDSDNRLTLLKNAEDYLIKELDSFKGVSTKGLNSCVCSSICITLEIKVKDENDEVVS